MQIGLKQLLLLMLTLSVVFGSLFGASKNMPIQDWRELTCSPDGKWLFALASEHSWLIDLESMEVANKFPIECDYFSNPTAAFIDEDTLVAVDSNRRVSPKIVWISISEGKIVRELAITPFSYSSVFAKHILVDSGNGFDILDSKDAAKLDNWKVDPKSKFHASPDGRYITRANPWGYSTPNTPPPATRVYDLQTESETVLSNATYKCLVFDDPSDPMFIGLRKASFRGGSIDGYYKDADFSLDGTRLHSGTGIYDRETRKLLCDLTSIRKPFESEYGRRVGVLTTLSADNTKVFLTNQNPDAGISIYDVTSPTPRLVDRIKVTPSRWGSILTGLAGIFFVNIAWVFLYRKSRDPNEELPYSPKTCKFIWTLMVIGSAIHIILNVVVMNHVPFAEIWSVDANFYPGARLRAAISVSLIVVVLLVAMFIFIRSAGASRRRLKTTALIQMFIDPVNFLLGLISLVVQFRSGKEIKTKADVEPSTHTNIAAES